MGCVTCVTLSSYYRALPQPRWVRLQFTIMYTLEDKPLYNQKPS